MINRAPDNREYGTRAIATFWLLATLLHAQGAVAGANDGRFYVLPMASYVLADDARSTDDAYGGALSIGRRLTEYVAVEISGSYLDYGSVAPASTGLLCNTLNLGCPESQDFDLHGGGLGLNLYPFQGNLYLHMQALAGNHGHYSAGLGYEIGGFGETSFVVEALYQSADNIEEPRINAGLKFPFGNAAAPPSPAPAPAPEPMPEPEPEPVRVVAAPCAITGPDGPVDLSGCETGDTVLLEGVTFALDSATLDPEAAQTLDRVAQALDERQDLRIEVRGHTDSSASERYNDRLSLRRAEAVKHYLASQDVTEDRIAVRGFGESEPVAGNNTPAGRAQNRRAELHVLEADATLREDEASAADDAASPSAADRPETGSDDPMGESRP